MLHNTKLFCFFLFLATVSCSLMMSMENNVPQEYFWLESAKKIYLKNKNKNKNLSPAEWGKLFFKQPLYHSVYKDNINNELAALRKELLFKSSFSYLMLMGAGVIGYCLVLVNTSSFSPKYLLFATPTVIFFFLYSQAKGREGQMQHNLSQYGQKIKDIVEQHLDKKDKKKEK